MENTFPREATVEGGTTLYGSSDMTKRLKREVRENQVPLASYVEGRCIRVRYEKAHFQCRRAQAPEQMYAKKQLRNPGSPVADTKRDSVNLRMCRTARGIKGGGSQGDLI